MIAERSVSRAAMRLRTTQPVVSSQLRRLRALTGDALLVRSGAGMVPTEAALALVAPAERLLREADQLFSPKSRVAGFVPAQSEVHYRIAASDYLDPLFLPSLVARLRQLAPQTRLEMLPLSAAFDYRRMLALGEVDLVVGNWLKPPEELHLGRLLDDEVCLVAPDHPAVKGGRAWTLQRYLDCDHVAPTALHAGAPGVIDEHLAAQGHRRRIAVHAAHFSLIPQMVARTQLVLTTGRQFCMRHAARLGLRIVRCPVAFPPLTYYQLWHERSHGAAPLRWLREQVRDVARELVLQAKGRKA